MWNQTSPAPHNNQARPQAFGAEDIARSIAARIVSGTGDMQLVDYSSGFQRVIPVAGHCLDEQDRWLISCSRHDFDHFLPTQVRLDVTMYAPHFQLVATAASAHALGFVEWVDTDGPWLTGIVDVSKLHVHYFSGVCSFDFSQLTDHSRHLPAMATDRLGAYDVASSLSQSDLARIVHAVETGVAPGTVLAPQYQPVCEHLRHRVFVIDICEVGIMMLKTTESSRIPVSATFPTVARSLTDLSNHLMDLVNLTSE
ncbi:hypothetical protein [Corynebacterium cystitidis]|uniref:hypothetical protein n=1 Tax=Corynebacterium cystitidis TaxID=35757 RepID=UPI00211E0812|nr:hypothetical protein [Corynebacterium cystitidis]